MKVLDFIIGLSAFVVGIYVINYMVKLADILGDYFKQKGHSGYWAIAIVSPFVLFVVYLWLYLIGKINI